MPDLPAGTVTFLFTDIEGSTRLWEEHPEPMRLALARHDALAEEIIQQHGGTLVKERGEGDSLFAVFARATDALAAACALQRALVEMRKRGNEETEARFPISPFPPLPLRVRMALHTGETELRAGDYYGPAVNRCARLRSLAHGGQVLLSQTTYDLVRDALPEGASLKDMGSHRLRDLTRAETTFQLLHPSLPSDFPLLTSLDNLPNNLPMQLTSFIGREKEIAEVRRLLAKTRLLTLAGAGGCGKTRLALQVAADLLEEYPDGIWLAELAALSDPSLVPQAVASALGVREEPGRALTETLTDYQQGRSLLLVLDNCEHLLTACARLVDSLLRTCPGLRVLASSREGLGISGETTYRIPSLSQPDPEHLPPMEGLHRYEAIQLFADRASAVAPAFRVTDRNAPAVAQICHRLDGIPLALELAAVRVRALSVEQIASRLDDRFHLLTGGSRIVLPRQQTLRATLDWSYDLLTEQERLLLRRLSVFVGGWTLEAAETVCSDSGLPVDGAKIQNPKSKIQNADVLDLLTSLVDKSLVIYEESEEGEGRYRLLETVRQYGQERLAETGEVEGLRGRHRDFFLSLAEKAEPLLPTPAQKEWFDRLDAEYENLWAALGWSAEKSPERGLRLACALFEFWSVRGFLTEGRERLKTLLASGGGVDESTRAKAVSRAGNLALAQADLTSARVLLEEALGLYRRLADKKGIAYMLNDLGNVAGTQGDLMAARAYYEESLPILRELADQRGVASVLNNLGIIAWFRGDYALARSRYEESLAIRRELREPREIANSLLNLGLLERETGNLTMARARLEESQDIARQLGDKPTIATILGDLGLVAYEQGDLAEARSLYKESLGIRRELEDKLGIAAMLHDLGLVACDQRDLLSASSLLNEGLRTEREIGDKRNIPASLEALANLATAQEQPERAARLWGAAETLREAIGSPLPPNERAEYDRDVSAVRSALGEEAFAAAWEEGRALTMEQAIAYALEETNE